MAKDSRLKDGVPNDENDTAMVASIREYARKLNNAADLIEKSEYSSATPIIGSVFEEITGRFTSVMMRSLGLDKILDGIHSLDDAPGSKGLMN